MRFSVAALAFEQVTVLSNAYWKAFKLTLAVGTVLSVYGSGVDLLAAEKPKPQQIRIRIVAAPPEVSAEGFVDGVNIGVMDSVNDLKKALNKKKCWHPTKKGQAAMPDAREFCFVLAGIEEHITVTVVSRGVNQQTLGARTTLTAYRGVIVADTVPTVGITRWVSIILGAGTYKKEIVAWYANNSKWSLGAWGKDAENLIQAVAEWCLANQKKLEN